ncbi:hypothetical protein [Bradyrhizobium sp. CCBAU 53421]|uniref:DUF6894 family protein n=1 Tax=Bradyrhizobium sp. CCBAU 53421 TaxID=1325120 RepID=UPI00188B6EB6|nr:hypothetical protein [Bradyrhizobium sp. CCBAU 53421]QOZ36926.1 hypothetical protein XH92_39680 [Bradyrhizobium sp. CCBAU 53421]
MKRYFFDIREGDELAVDEEGILLPDIEAAEIEAAKSLADVVRDRAGANTSRQVTIEVRDESGAAVAELSLQRPARRH